MSILHVANPHFGLEECNCAYILYVKTYVKVKY